MRQSVVVLSPHQLFRRGLRRALEAVDGLVVIEAHDESALVAADVVVVDSPESRAASRVRANWPSARVLRVADTDRVGHDGVVDIDRRRGLAGLVDAVRDPDHRPRRRWTPPAFEALPLTDREQAVLEHLSAGVTSADIARLLSISPRTVENYKRRLFTKLGAATQAQAVAIALRTGLVVLPGDASADGTGGTS
jgi:DNA-binding NarL/FixJ family response regulator